MEYSKKLLILILFSCFVNCPATFAQTQLKSPTKQSSPTKPSSYSAVSIQIYNAGVASQKQKNYDIAEKQYNRVLSMQPNFVEAKMNLAIMYQTLASRNYAQTEYTKGIYYAKKSLTFRPNNIDSYNIMALCYLELKDNENLISTYKKIISLDPKDDFAMSSLASAYIKTNQMDKTVEIYKKILSINPNDDMTKRNLAIVYQNLANKNYSNSEYEKTIYYAKQSLSFNPDNVNPYHLMAQSYSALKDYENANEIYKKILLISPDDHVAQQNLKYTNFKHNDRVLNESINNLEVGHIAPERLYRLITPQAGVDIYLAEKMKTILDLIWSEPNGRILLSALLKNDTPINITNGYVKANAARTKQTKTFYVYGIIPVASFTSNSSVNVNIPVSHIENFNNPNLYASQRIYNLQVFIHEFGHAFIGIKNPNDVNSMEEEIGVSMIGYNIANKIITGKYLDKNETETYSIDCLKALLSDEHKDLPVFSGFDKTIQNYGVAMPYPEIYSNLPLMYKKLLSEGKVSPTPSFYNYVR